MGILLAIHFVVTIALIGLILIQKSNGDGALGSSGGGSASGMFSRRGQSNLLTKATAILMFLFFVNCIAMARNARFISNSEKSSGSTLDKIGASEKVDVKP